LNPRAEHQSHLSHFAHTISALPKGESTAIDSDSDFHFNFNSASLSSYSGQSVEVDSGFIGSSSSPSYPHSQSPYSSTPSTQSTPPASPRATLKKVDSSSTLRQLYRPAVASTTSPLSSSPSTSISTSPRISFEVTLTKPEQKSNQPKRRTVGSYRGRKALSNTEDLVTTALFRPTDRTLTSTTKSSSSTSRGYDPSDLKRYRISTLENPTSPSRRRADSSDLSSCTYDHTAASKQRLSGSTTSSSDLFDSQFVPVESSSLRQEIKPSRVSQYNPPVLDQNDLRSALESLERMDEPQKILNEAENVVKVQLVQMKRSLVS